MNIENWPTVMQRALRLFFCLVVLFLSSQPLHAQEGDAERRSWILKLNSSVRAERNEARTALRAIGPAILPELRRQASATDSGTRFVLQQFQREIERDVVDTILRGRRISIHAASLHQGVERLAQTGGTQVILGPGSPEVAFNPPLKVDDVLFWDALEKLCQASETAWHWKKQTPGDSILAQIVVTSQAHRNSEERSAVSGCFRIAATPVHREGAPTQRWRIRVDAEEPVRPLYALVRDAGIQLSGKGARYAPFDPDARREVNFQGQTGAFQIDFLPANSESDPPQQMKGQLQIRCEVLPQELTFRTDAGQTQVQYAGDTEIRLVSTRRDGDSLHATVAVTFPPSVDWQSHQLGHLHQEVWLAGTDGASTSFRFRTLASETMPTHVVHYEFPVAEEMREPFLIYRAPSADRIVEVNFEIPLTP